MNVHFVLISEGSSEEPLVAHLIELCLGAGAREASGYRVDFGRYPNPPGKQLSPQLHWLSVNAPSANLVFIHRDADASDDHETRARIARGVEQAQLSVAHVPVVPIQELEAWLLLDEDEIRRVAGNPNGRAELGLPKPKAIERRANPKDVLKQAIARAAKPGARKPNFFACRRRLLERLDLDGPINHLSGWQKLRSDIQDALTVLAGE